MAINWADDDILMMGSTLGRELRHYKDTDVDDATLGKLAVWFMNNYDEMNSIYWGSERLMNYMNIDDTDFIQSDKPSVIHYKQSLKVMNPMDWALHMNGGQYVRTMDTLKDNPSKSRFFDVMYEMGKFHYRILKIYSSGQWVKNNPLAQSIWFIRTQLLVLFAQIRFTIWYRLLRISKDAAMPVVPSSKHYYTYRELMDDYVSDWYGQYGYLTDPSVTKAYKNDYQEMEQRKLYRQWGVDPSLLDDQREFIKSLALLIRRGLSSRDRKATTFQHERHNTANELKSLLQTGWSPDLPEVDVQECSKCDGLGYREGGLDNYGKRKKRKCTSCQGWGTVGEHIWIYSKKYNTGRYSKTPEIRKKDKTAENTRRRFDRLVSNFRSECVGNYK